MQGASSAVPYRTYIDMRPDNPQPQSNTRPLANASTI